MQNQTNINPSVPVPSQAINPAAGCNNLQPATCNLQPPPSFPAFSEAVARHDIDPRRLAKFFGPFSESLSAAGISFPDHESANGSYFDSISAALASPERLPAPLRAALSTLETAATLENQNRLDEALNRRIPNVSLTPCPVDRALELWFLLPDELVQFQPPAADVGPPSPARASDSPFDVRCSMLDVQSSAPSPLAPLSSDQFSVAHLAKEEALPVLRSASGEGGLTQEDVGPLPSAGEPFKVEMASPARTSKLDVQSSSSPAPSTLNSPTLKSPAQLDLPEVEPWPEPVNGKTLLDALVALLNRFVVLPKWAAETLALWIVHTFAFQLRDVSTYIGLESPEKQCGKTTLLTVLGELANRAVTASNISPPAFFRVIEDLCPTLLIDEADTFLRGNEQLKGIMNAGYKRKTGFVWRAVYQLETSSTPDVTHVTHLTDLTHLTPAPNALGAPRSTLDTPLQVQRFSCWCPKLISQIGRLPDTLADRCIVIRMQRKTRHEECERLRNLDAETLKRQCARFVLDHGQQIASAKPELPPSLSDRAADIWEPLLALADLAGGDWPQKARQAAVGLSAVAQESNPLGSLLNDIFIVFASTSEERLFTKTLLQRLLSNCADRPWAELRQGKPITELWLSQKLRPYGIYPRTMRIGEARAKGYLLEDFKETFQRYLPKAELLALVAEAKAAETPGSQNSAGGAPAAPV